MYNNYETKISNSLIALFVTAFSSSSSRYFLSHVGLGSPFTPSLYKRHYMLPMKIYPYLSYRREINETDVNYTCNLQKVWDSSDSLNGNSCSLFRPYSIYNSNNQWRFFNTMECDHREKGKGKRTIFRYFIFLDRSFRSLITLRRNHLHSQPFKLRRDCM